MRLKPSFLSCLFVIVCCVVSSAAADPGFGPAPPGSFTVAVIPDTQLYQGRDTKADPKGRMQWKKCHSQRGNTPVQMWDKCFKLHKNIILICSGDQSRTQAKHISEPGVHGNIVHSCLSDYGSDGSLRLYRFIPQDGRVDAITYNVFRGHLTRKTVLAPDEREHQFSFEYSME